MSASTNIEKIEPLLIEFIGKQLLGDESLEIDPEENLLTGGAGGFCWPGALGGLPEGRIGHRHTAQGFTARQFPQCQRDKRLSAKPLAALFHLLANSLASAVRSILPLPVLGRFSRHSMISGTA